MTPKKVEYVAANIMNLSNTEIEITPEQAEAILQLSLSSPARINRIADDSLKPIVEESYFSHEERKSLGERIKTLCEFNSDMNSYMKNYMEEQKKL